MDDRGRRAYSRERRRLSCAFRAEGADHKGVVLDLSPRGLFVQTTATPELTTADLAPRVDALTVVTLAELAAQDRGLEIAHVSEPALVLTRAARGEVVAPTLAWRLEVYGAGPAVPTMPQFEPLR